MNDIVERLAAKGVTPEQALRDIERSKDYMKIIASDDGQALLEYLADEAMARRRDQPTRREGASGETE